MSQRNSNDFVRRSFLRAAALSSVALGMTFAIAGCGSDDAATGGGGEGSLTLSVGGGAALQQGFPYTEGDVEYAFVDGWSLEFTKYVVVLGGVQMRDPAGGSVVGEWSGPAVLDLATGGGNNQELTTLQGLPATRLDIEFDLLHATASADNRSASPEDFDDMVQNGWSFLVEGNASKEGRTVAFRFGLGIQSHYEDCINGKDKTKGIAIERDKTIGAFIYAHALHLFWDTLAAGDESLRFDAFAAVAGDDDLVTNEELRQQDLTDLRDENGDPLRDADGSRVMYNDGGSLPPDQQNLEAFLNYAARAGIHFNGVGLCASSPL